MTRRSRQLSAPIPAAPASGRLDIARRVCSGELFAGLLQHLGRDATEPVRCGGLWGCAAALLLAGLARELASTVLVACPGANEAERLEEDLTAFSPMEVRGFPAWDVLPGEIEEPESDCLAGRLGALEALRRATDGQEPAIVVTPAAALMQPAPRPGRLFRGQLEVRTGGQLERARLMAWLAERGYERVPAVAAPGEFAVRGGIVDVFPLFSAAGCRIEFGDDRIESLREFDPDSQRSTGSVTSVRLAGLDRAAAFSGAEASLLDYLPPGGLLVVVEPEDLASHAELYAAGFTGRGKRKSPSLADLKRRLELAPRRLILRRVGTEEPGELDFGARSLERLSHSSTAKAVSALLKLASERKQVAVFSGNRAESERLGELVAEADGQAPASLRLMVGRISGGFDWPAGGLAVVSERELLGRYRERRRVRPRPALPSIPIESLADLVPGDYVVHRTHGIGRYLGMEAINRNGRLEEHLLLLYAEEVRLYVPATSVGLVSRYLAPGGAKPGLSRIGSKRWVERTRRAKAAVRDIAADLLELTATRARQPGITCPPPDEWEDAFVNSFPYEDTPDQAAAWQGVREDLESSRPADRLLCGDVGFGKTEIAIRAAFKVVTAGRQVAILVPTTLLAEQHGRTFRERMADYPVRVEVLSRFRTGAEQRAILEGLAEGTIDVVIGTHRLLQNDVTVKDLGLVIIDEEQRFGVLHKEKLKRLRAAVNVLTLTATPIPRTLHMAMLGLRDISSLQTAPADRLAVRTRVARWNDDLLRRAILRELARDGQVYFVHNRVHSIDRIAARLEELIPEARVAVAHGQMTESELDRAMGDFLARRADVLVSTVIIESGLDIPNVNTIFIDRADRFGLADLHQLRGRVGRYMHRAYCYLLIPPEEMVSAEALARVKALEEFSDLGAGFRLAMRDLELRGAGNILGAQQSGNIAAIGYDLYARLMERISRELRGETVPEEWECSVHLADRALLPEAYLPDESERLEVYRRLAACSVATEVDELVADLEDRYGRPPEEVDQLVAEARLRIRARAARVALVAVADGRLTLKFFGRPARKAAVALGRRGAPRFPDNDTLTLAIPAASRKGDALLEHAGRVLEHLRLDS